MTAASFQYDALGRRVSRNVAGTATDFLYDGASAVQELAGGTPTANLLNGLAIDEVFTRTDAVGARHVLADALGSTIALTDGNGTVTTQHTYDPFGGTATAGELTGNPFQFTGREADGTGLYYYRARYYDPSTPRFASEDPLDFVAGDPNLYAYVFDDPTDLTDPSGKIAPWVAACLGGAAFDVASDLLLSGRYTPSLGDLRSNEHDQ